MNSSNKTIAYSFRFLVSLTLLFLFTTTGLCQRRDAELTSLGITMVNARDIFDMVRFRGLQLPRRSGVVVLSVMENSPAEKAGIVPSTLIRSFNDQRISDVRALLDELTKVQPGTEVNIYSMRPWASHGNRIWKPHATRITPVAYRDILMGTLSKTKNPKGQTVAWSHSKSPAPKSKTTFISASIRKRGRHDPELWITNHYCSINWMHVSRTKLTINEEEYELNFELADQAKDCTHIYEWATYPVDKPIFNLLETIARAGDQDVIVRYYGIQNEHERLLTADEKIQLSQVLEAFEMMGGDIK